MMDRLLKKKEFLLLFFCSLSGFLLGEGSAFFTGNHETPSTSSSTDIAVPPKPGSASHSYSFTSSRKFYEGELVGTKSLKVERIVAKLLKGEIPDSWEEELQNVMEASFSGEGDHDALLVLFSRWAETDFPQAFQAAANLNLYVVKKELIQQYAERSPREALEYYINHKAIIFADIYLLVDGASQSWARQSPAEALDWCLDKLTPGSIEQGIALTNAIEEVGFHSPEGQELLNKVLAHGEKIPEKVLLQWAQNDPDSAREWVFSKEGLGFAEKATILTGMLTKAPEKTIEMLLSMPEKDQSKYLSWIIREIEDKSVGFNFLLDVKPLSQITEADLSYVERWAFKSPQEAERWISQLAGSPVKDIAIHYYVEGLNTRRIPPTQEFASSLTQTHPYETALEMVDNMENEERKARTKELLFQNWEKQDAHSLEEWKKRTAAP